MTKTFFEIRLHHSQAITLSIEIFSRYSMICSVFHLQSQNFYLMGLGNSDHIRERRINTKCILGYFYFKNKIFQPRRAISRIQNLIESLPLGCMIFLKSPLNDRDKQLNGCTCSVALVCHVSPLFRYSINSGLPK